MFFVIEHMIDGCRSKYGSRVDPQIIESEILLHQLNVCNNYCKSRKKTESIETGEIDGFVCHFAKIA